MTEQHLVIIIDNDKKVEPKKYTCPRFDKTKEQAVSAAKKTYELNHQNFNYESYYFLNQI